MIVRAERILCSEAETAAPTSLVIRGAMIQAISGDAFSSKGEEVFDYSGLTIAPCFCDYHMHAASADVGRFRHMTEMLLRHGIVRAYDGGDRQGAGLEVRKLPGKVGIKTAGYALYKKGGYGSHLGRPALAGEDAERTIHELCTSGIDYLKVIQSGIYDPESDIITKGGFEQDELKRIIACAREQGLAVFCHANGDQAVLEAVHAGASTVIHGLRVSLETLSLLAKRKIAFIPTVNAFRSLRLHAKSDAARLNIDRAVAGHLSTIERAFHLGVRLLPGSDSGPDTIPHGASYLEEMRMFLSAGIPYDYILQAVAASPLKAGIPADFVVLDGLTVQNVMLGGKFLLPSDSHE